MMRHSKRHILTTQDIESAFRKLSIKVSSTNFRFIHLLFFQETYGYPSSAPLTYQKVSHEN